VGVSTRRDRLEANTRRNTPFRATGVRPAEFGVRVCSRIVSGSHDSQPYRTVQVHIAKTVPAIAHPADLLAPGSNGR
jgi:hypothetical protein